MPFAFRPPPTPGERFPLALICSVSQLLRHKGKRPERTFYVCMSTSSSRMYDGPAFGATHRTTWSNALFVRGACQRSRVVRASQQRQRNTHHQQQNKSRSFMTLSFQKLVVRDHSITWEGARDPGTLRGFAHTIISSTGFCSSG